ncbi:MAG: DUF2092 domain-containing protein [Gammaproteobacteria bacterium]|jgi:hypothetical protein|nr:DUF2092 domain-containing protein [Gammaproteobacteria bacterium]MBP6051819.1 DUF2092 domain-containing protein [Pseudomonadales bacterium]MBK6582956.1 DUF2092 domain-containing protein [Gammaproteobacteria bacterium]MBK7168156.1 DUF2092 domain-containing protein [Gammaproteobacteria bacterium]MBK7519087.1 DUF2092 domain-containing protein [Gammaproteobacteria bacterium]
MNRKRSNRFFSFCASLVLAATVGGKCYAEDAPVASGAEPTASAPDARAILMGMAQFMAKTPRYSMRVLSAYDSLQDTGEKLEFAAIRRITVRRPDHLRVEVEESNGETNQLLFDGKTLSAFSGDENVYAQSKQAGDIDAALKTFVGDLKMRLPLALLLTESLPRAFERRVKTVDYVESTTIFGAPAHHLSARGDTVDFQIWVSDGPQPLPLRIVLTYRDYKGQPQFRAQFVDWNLAPDTVDAVFAFKPPKDARKIQFLARMGSMVALPPAAESLEGEQP